jgi:hypothetical protein
MAQSTQDKIQNAIIFAVAMISLGAGLVVYAHANFASKSTVEKLDDRIYQIWIETVPADKRNARHNQ